MRALHFAKTFFLFFLVFGAQTMFAQKLSALGFPINQAVLDLVKTPPTVADREARFSDERQNLSAFIQKNLTYPSLAHDYGIEGLVQVRFLVDVDGRIKNATVIRRLGFDCDQAVLDLLNKMPRWLPEIKNGVAKPSFQLLQVQFSL